MGQIRGKYVFLPTKNNTVTFVRLIINYQNIANAGLLTSFATYQAIYDLLLRDNCKIGPRFISLAMLPNSKTAAICLILQYSENPEIRTLNLRVRLLLVLIQ